MLVPIALIPALFLLVFLAFSLLNNAIRGRSRGAISVMVTPIFAGSVFLFVGHLGISVDLVYFEILKPLYLRQVDEMPPTTSKHRMKIWDWGETGGAAVVNIFYTLIYDDSDQIQLPPTLRSKDWVIRATQAANGSGFYSVIHPEDFGSGENISVEHLDGHFYLIEEIFQ
jgi:hypothetical protein